MRSKSGLEELFNSHHYTDGISLLKQGTSTNNTDSVAAGFSQVEFGNDVTHSVEREADLFEVVERYREKTDGQILSEALGVDYDTFQHVYHSNGYDIRNAMFMNNVLWQTTAGYYLRDMLAPLVNDAMLEETRQFFMDYVRSRGALPSIRSGRQPYGILPATAMSQMEWTNEPSRAFYESIYFVTEKFNKEWKKVADNLKHAGAALTDGERKQMMIDAMAKSPVSVDYYQRTGVGAGYIWNNLAFNCAPEKSELWFNSQKKAAFYLNNGIGISLPYTPRIMQMNFLKKNMRIKMPLTVDKTSKLPIAPIAGSDINFIGWLRTAPLAKIKSQDFSDIATNPNLKPPKSLLYRLIRQSLLLEYWETGVKLEGGRITDNIEGELINIGDRRGKPNKNNSAGTPVYAPAQAAPVYVEGAGIPEPEPTPGGASAETEFDIYTSQSRWKIFDRDYMYGQTMGEFLSGGRIDYLTEAKNLVQV